ncbi:MAG: SPW repeat domain-containing protein [Sulfuricaulis sp.]
MKPNGDIVLITGANGRIGAALMRRLSERFDNVVGFDLKAPTPPPPDCVRIPVDITSDESVQEGLRVLREHHGTRIAAVVHLAAYYDFLGKPSPKYGQVTVGGTGRLLHGLHDGFEVEQFIFSSTMLVHRSGEPGVFMTEDSPIEPTWAYPESKVRTEALIRAERGDIPAVILRIAGVYDDHCHSPPLAHQIQRIYERQFSSHLYSGETSHGQSFIHEDDLLDAIERVVDRRAQLPRESTILLGEPEVLSYDELQHTFLRLIHNESWETHNVPRPIAKAGAWMQDQLPGKDSFIKPWMIDRANDHYALDITRAHTLLNWAPNRSLRKTLPKMVAALQADPLGWYRENDLEPPSSLSDNAESSMQGAQLTPDHTGHSDLAPALHDPDTHPVARAAEPTSAGGGVTYSCPMHPEVVRSEPGSCPKCGMTLEPRKAPVADHSEHADMMVEGHRKMLWPHYVNLMLGFWLLTSPFTLGYLSNHVPDANVLRVMAERGLPSFEIRNLAMTWSDVISGILVIVFSALSASPSRRYPWAQWANATVGFWLLFAPLIFWTPLPEAYANATLVGALVIAFSVLIPMMPGMSMAGMMDKSEIPPGWAYTPASWLQRMPIAVLGLFGFFIARYMAAYQLGHIDRAWDPFFGAGTMTIITSDMSKAWPIPDAGLGAVAYMLEVLMTFMGGKNRWRTMPWMILMLGILMVPLGGVSVFFIIIQPMLIGTWCTLCLIAGLAMVLMIPYSLDEFVAMGQFLVAARKKGKPFWRTFWMGDAMEGGRADSSKAFLGTTREMTSESARGVTFPVTLLLATIIGIWLMFTRLTFDNAGAMANSDYLVGASVVTFSIIAFAEVARSMRLINILFGVWLIAAPWLLNGVSSPLATGNSIICGALLIALAIPRGTIRDSYASWDRYIV